MFLHLVAADEAPVGAADTWEISRYFASPACRGLLSMRRNAKTLNGIAEDVAKLEEQSALRPGKAALFHGQGRTNSMAFIAVDEPD